MELGTPSDVDYVSESDPPDISVDVSKTFTYQHQSGEIATGNVLDIQQTCLALGNLSLSQIESLATAAEAGQRLLEEQDDEEETEQSEESDEPETEDDEPEAPKPSPATVEDKGPPADSPDRVSDAAKPHISQRSPEALVISDVNTGGKTVLTESTTTSPESLTPSVNTKQAKAARRPATRPHRSPAGRRKTDIKAAKITTAGLPRRPDGANPVQLNEPITRTNPGQKRRVERQPEPVPVGNAPGVSESDGRSEKEMLQLQSNLKNDELDIISTEIVSHDHQPHASLRASEIADLPIDKEFLPPSADLWAASSEPQSIEHEIAGIIPEFHLPFEEVEQTLMLIAERIEELDDKAVDGAYEMLEQIAERVEAAQAIPESGLEQPGAASEKEAIEKEIKELFYQLLDQLEIDYTPELIDCFAALALKDDLPQLTTAGEELNTPAIKDKGTHEVINQLLTRLNGVKKIISRVALLGKSAVGLCKLDSGLTPSTSKIAVLS